MKRLIYLTYLGLLALMLLACEKEIPVPAQDTASLASTDADARKACAIFGYQSNLIGNVIFGNARPDVLIVGFRQGMPLAKRQQILAQYPIYLSTDPDYQLNAGTLTIVNLKPGVTCNQVAAMLRDLESRPVVRFAAPVFDPDDPTYFKWRGQTNQVIVTMNDTVSARHLKMLCRQSNTRIVARITDDIFLVGLDKYSAGNALQISSAFNRSPKVLNAEPDLLFQRLPFFVNDPNRTNRQNTLVRKYPGKLLEMNDM